MTKSESVTTQLVVGVGSHNPVKVNAVRQTLMTRFPQVIVEGWEVASGVPAQPRTDEETYRGAMNRAHAVLAQAQARQVAHVRSERRDLKQPATILGVGLEGGVFSQGSELWSTVWVVVEDEEGLIYPANGARFPIPLSVARLIQDGQDMGSVMEKMAGERDIGSKQGMIGVITHNFTDRTTEYASIAQMAFGLWYGRNWEKILKQTPSRRLK
jgi:inosine/xanthosine triphosphatase